ncbi:hypothetical protein V496_06800 [Pseudogymnoascus sp. VKM F-4515 (FW-2607)]|nr:hypothetical protein V496_06800 [Pseudogymnoascus sp. VKM F-4515 (FW-2607)]
MGGSAFQAHPNNGNDGGEGQPDCDLYCKRNGACPQCHDPFLELDISAGTLSQVRRRQPRSPPICQILHHHELEETVLFPGFEREAGVEGIMAANVVQHHEFAPGFDIFVKYVKDCSDDKSEERFEAKKFRQLIDGFAPKLTLHLADEIPTLLSLDKYDEKKMKKIYDDFEKVVKDGDFKKDELYPLVVGSHDKGLKGGEHWPPVPQFVIYLVAYWLSRKYRSAWRFNPCDFFGKKRPLLFGPTVEDR